MCMLAMEMELRYSVTCRQSAECWMSLLVVSESRAVTEGSPCRSANTPTILSLWAMKGYACTILIALCRLVWTCTARPQPACYTRIQSNFMGTVTSNEKPLRFAMHLPWHPDLAHLASLVVRRQLTYEQLGTKAHAAGLADDLTVSMCMAKPTCAIMKECSSPCR